MQHLLLLSFVIANLRDSAFGHRLEETKTELPLAERLLELIGTDRVTQQQLSDAIALYRKNGAQRQCLYTDHRAEIYSSVLTSDFPTESNLPVNAIEIEILFLEIGLKRIAYFCFSGKLELCYFEAQHLHNSPKRLYSNYVMGLQYYLDVEKPFVIDRFDAAIVDPELLPAKAYQKVWAEMDAILSTHK